MRANHDLPRLTTARKIKRIQRLRSFLPTTLVITQPSPRSTITFMRQSLTTIAVGALLLSQSVLAGLYSARDGVVDITTQTFQSEVIDSNVTHICYGLLLRGYSSTLDPQRSYDNSSTLWPFCLAPGHGRILCPMVWPLQKVQ